MRAVGDVGVHDVLVAPVVSEKAVAASGVARYVFEVAKGSTKPAIKRAVELMFDVRVKGVNTLRRRGKSKRFKGYSGQRRGVKRAVVSLEDGCSIDLVGPRG